MQLFFSHNINKNMIELSKSESNHCVKVLRKSLNDLVQVIDGCGNLYRGRLVDLNPNKALIEITEVKKNFGVREKYVHIAIAPTKKVDRFEWFVEKVVEIGIDEISLIKCQNSERFKINQERIRKIILSATKQSLKGFLPKLNQIEDFKHFVKKDYGNSRKSIAYLKNEITSTLLDQCKGSSNLVCIGPEGDFTDLEIDCAISNGFYPITLGKSRLRTETAGLVACTLMNI